MLSPVLLPQHPSRRRFLQYTLAAVPFFTAPLLAACSAASGSSTKPVTASRQQSTSHSTAAQAANNPNAAAVKLSFVTWGSVDEIKTRQHYTAQFNTAHPSIHVSFAPVTGNYWTAIQTRMAGGDAPDVYYLEPGHVLSLRCRSALLDLSPYVARDKFSLSDFYSRGITEYTIASKLWALPRDFANQDIFYNVDLFQKAGVSLPPKRFDAKGWTFTDFLAACQKLTSGSGPTKTFGFAVPQGFRAYMMFVWSNGGDIVSPDDRKPTINQPDAVEGLQFLEDLIGKYHVAPTPADLQTQNANNLFYTGRVGMIVSIPAQLALFRKSAKSFQWDVAPPPLGPHGTKRWVGGGGAGFGVYGKTPHADQAWQLMQWVTSATVQKEEVDAGTSMGSRLSVGQYFIKVNQGKDPANVKMFVEASEHNLHTDPHASHWLQIGNLLTKEFADLWDVRRPAQEVTNAVAQQMAPLLLEPC
ncbi:MAG: sugar ABC transporter substrate-binding protein [Chloroflexi bacterium]|nr:sugar ABC transporter substrate-binding protein [Chloroflexota bacterium]